MVDATKGWNEAKTNKCVIVDLVNVDIIGEWQHWKLDWL